MDTNLAEPGRFSILSVPTGPVGAVMGDPHGPTHIYLGGSEGLYHSTDGGATWALLSRELRYPHVLLVDPSDSQRLYAARRDLGPFLPLPGVYRSVDGGRTWAALSTGLGAERIFALALDPLRRGTLYAGSWAGRVYKSVDGGATWGLVATVRANPTAAPSTIAQLLVSPVGGTVYAVESYGGTFRSGDGGLSWEQVRSDGGWLAVDRQRGDLYLAGRRLQRPRDGGATWADLGPGLPYNPDAGSYATFWVAVNPAPPRLYTRYHCSPDGGASWQPLEAPANFVPRALLPGSRPALYGSVNGQAGRYQEMLRVGNHS